MRRNAVLLLIELGGGYADGQKMKTLDALPALLEATYDYDVSVRAWAAHAIAEMGPSASSAFPRLVELLDDPESAPRNTAAIALGRMGVAARETAPALRAAAAAACESDSRKIVCKAIQRIEGVTPSVCRPVGDR